MNLPHLNRSGIKDIMATTMLDTIKNLVDKLNEDDLCALIDYMAKKVWIPTYVPRERFDIPMDAYTDLINDDNLNNKVNDFACYLLQNRFDNQEEDDDEHDEGKPNEAVVEIELENDQSMTVEGLIERMCTITEKVDT